MNSPYTRQDGAAPLNREAEAYENFIRHGQSLYPQKLYDLGFRERDLEGKSLVDIASGSFRNLERFLSRAVPSCEVYSLDAMNKRHYEDLPDDHFFLGNAHELPYVDEYFDYAVISCAPVLSHLAVPEALRVLKSDGELHYSDPFEVDRGEWGAPSALYYNYRDKITKSKGDQRWIFTPQGRSLMSQYQGERDELGLPTDADFWVEFLLNDDCTGKWERSRIYKQCISNMEANLNIDPDQKFRVVVTPIMRRDRAGGESLLLKIKKHPKK